MSVTEYTYIGKDGKPILARDLEDQRDKLAYLLDRAVNGPWQGGMLEDARTLLAKIKGEEE